MKFGQLIEYNMRNALFKNHVQCGMKKISPDLKNQNWEYLWIISLKYYIVAYNSFKPLPKKETVWN